MRYIFSNKVLGYLRDTKVEIMHTIKFNEETDYNGQRKYPDPKYRTYFVLLFQWRSKYKNSEIQQKLYLNKNLRPARL